MIMDTSIIRTLPSVPIVDSEIYTVRTHTGDTGLHTRNEQYSSHATNVLK